MHRNDRGRYRCSGGDSDDHGPTKEQSLVLHGAETHEDNAEGQRCAIGAISVVLQGHADEGVNSEDWRNGDNQERNPLDFIQNVLQLYGRK